MIKEMDLVELIIRKAISRSPDGKITRNEFLNEAAKITRFSLFTPMEADILFHFASLDEPSGRLGLHDFVKVLDPSWVNRGVSEESIVGQKIKSAGVSTLMQVAASAYSFVLGSMAGFCDSFIPISFSSTQTAETLNAVPLLLHASMQS